jgi:hypothetical protein
MPLTSHSCSSAVHAGLLQSRLTWSQAQFDPHTGPVRGVRQA